MANQKKISINNKWILIPAIIMGLLTVNSNAFAQLRIQNSIKFGVMFFSTLQTALYVDNKDIDTRAVNSDNLTGSIFYLEKIIQNYFGYEIRYGLFNQDLQMKIDGINSNVTNTASLFSGSMRAYAQSHRRNGINYYGAVNVGLLASNIVFVQAPPDTLQGTNYSFATYAIGAEAGFDYLIRFAGIRAALGYQYGAQSSIGEEDSTYKIRYDLASPYYVIGVFSFF